MKHAQCHTVQQDHQHGRSLEPCGEQQLRNATKAESNSSHADDKSQKLAVTTSKEKKCISAGFLQWPHYPIQIYKLLWQSGARLSLPLQFTIKKKMCARGKMSHRGGVGEPTCGCSEWQSLLPHHPVNQRSVCKACWKMFSLLARVPDKHFKEIVWGTKRKKKKRQERQMLRDLEAH